MPNNTITIGPVALTNTLTTNVFSPGTALTTTSGVNLPSLNPYVVIRHVRIVNKTGSPATFSFWLGASAGNVAGTEVIGIAQTVVANSAYDWYGYLRVSSSTFLVGGASANTTLTFQAEADFCL